MRRLLEYLRRKRIAGLFAVGLVTVWCLASPGWAAESQADRMLITPDALQQRLGDENLRILDVRPEDEYRAGHLPGAARVELDRWKAFAKAEGALRDRAGWAERVGQLGIGPDTDVVVYGGKLNEAARVWWLLEYLGHDRVRLLDGDWSGWTEAERPTDTDAPEIEPAEFKPRFQPERLAEIEDVKAWLGDRGVSIVDARTADEYTGRAVREGNPRGGHLPGAIHLNWEDLKRDDGRFKRPEALRAMFEALGLERDETVVTHCNTGGRGAAEAFALELAGYRNVKNYYCAFQQWSADEEAPVEKGK